MPEPVHATDAEVRAWERNLRKAAAACHPDDLVVPTDADPGVFAALNIAPPPPVPAITLQQVVFVPVAVDVRGLVAFLTMLPKARRRG